MATALEEYGTESQVVQPRSCSGVGSLMVQAQCPPVLDWECGRGGD